MTTRQQVHAEHLGEARTQAWRALRAFNENAGPDTSGALFEASETLRIACEQYRRRYHPTALELFATCDDDYSQPLEIFIRTLAGEAIQVWPADG